MVEGVEGQESLLHDEGGGGPGGEGGGLRIPSCRETLKNTMEGRVSKWSAGPLPTISGSQSVGQAAEQESKWEKQRMEAGSTPYVASPPKLAAVMLGRAHADLVTWLEDAPVVDDLVEEDGECLSSPPTSASPPSCPPFLPVSSKTPHPSHLPLTSSGQWQP